MTKLEKIDFLRELNKIKNALDSLINKVFESKDTPEISAQNQNPDSFSRWFTAPELARRFKVSPGTIYKWVKKGFLPKGVQFGEHQQRWNLADVEEFFWEIREAKKAENAENAKQKIDTEGSCLNVIIQDPAKNLKKRRGRQSKIRRCEEFI